MENPINEGKVKFGVAFAAFEFVSFNLFVLLVAGFYWITVLLTGLFAVAILVLTAGQSEFANHPRVVELTDEGVVMHRRLGRKPVLVRWSDILWVSHMFVMPEERDWACKSTNIAVSKHRWFVLHWTVGEAVLERYKAVTGRYPPNRVLKGLGVKEVS